MTETEIFSCVTMLATVVIAISAIISSRLTYRLTEDNRLLRKAGTEPKVVAYIGIDKRELQCLNVVIANIGNGPAYDVEVSREADEENFQKYVVSFKETPSRPPMPLLPQGDRIETFLNVGHQLFDDQTKEPVLKPFRVNISFKNSDGKPDSTTQLLDIAALGGIVTVGRPPERVIADAVEAISKDLGKVVSNEGKIQVETMTVEDVKEQKQRQIEATRKRREERKTKK